MKYLFVLIFIAVYLLCGEELGYSIDSPIYTHLTYMFQHIGITHIIMNSVAFIIVFHNLQKLINKHVISIAIIFCGFIASFPSAYETVTVGASSMVYAMIGMSAGATAFDKKIKIVDTRRYLLFLSCVAVGLLISLLRHNSNFFVHLYSMALGFAISFPIVRIKS